MDRLTDCLEMTIVVDWDVKQQNKRTNITIQLLVRFHIYSCVYLGIASHNSSPLIEFILHSLN